MFEFFGGSVPRIVADNLKTGVIQRPGQGEIVLNMVGHVPTWEIAALRKASFATLAGLRHAIYEQVAAYNREAFKKGPAHGQRSSLPKSANSYDRYRRQRMRSLTGRMGVELDAIVTSPGPKTTTRCPTPTLAKKSMCASPKPS